MAGWEESMAAHLVAVWRHLYIHIYTILIEEQQKKKKETEKEEGTQKSKQAVIIV